jgi:hypothetical protein
VINKIISWFRCSKEEQPPTSNINWDNVAHPTKTLAEKIRKAEGIDFLGGEVPYRRTWVGAGRYWEYELDDVVVSPDAFTRLSNTTWNFSYTIDATVMVEDNLSGLCFDVRCELRYESKVEGAPLVRLGNCTDVTADVLSITTGEVFNEDESLVLKEAFEVGLQKLLDKSCAKVARDKKLANMREELKDRRDKRSNKMRGRRERLRINEIYGEEVE